MDEKTGKNNDFDFDDLFYKSLDGEVYKKVLSCMEKPLFEWILKKTDGNQIKASKILGINRNTFRTKVKKLGINPLAYK